MSPTPSVDVLIVGAGVGGAALALALGARFPLRVLAVDRRAGPGNINRGDSLLPAVTQHLHAWGALPAIRAAGARPVGKMQVFHHQAGLLFQAPLTLPGDPAVRQEQAPYLVLPHPEIERALCDTARATGRVEVRYQCRASRLLRAGDDPRGRVIGAVLLQEQGETAVLARLVVGADGASSLLRAMLHIDFPQTAYDHGFYIVEVERPPDYEDAMRIELHPEGSILVVPQGAERVGLGVLVRQADEDLFRAGALPAKLSAIGRRSRLLAGQRPFAKGAHLYSLARGHARRYTADGAALLGDAVHVTNPTAGQGMTMAIEDAAALASHLGPALTRGAAGAELDASLLAYQRERWPRNASQIRWSHWLSRFYALPGASGDLIHRLVFGLGASSFGQRIQQQVWSRMATRDRRAA
jgi:salicylate hydroxylase